MLLFEPETEEQIVARFHLALTRLPRNCANMFSIFRTVSAWV